MPTYVQRELAGVSPISEPTLPTESKYDSDEKKDEAKLHRIEAKELREFNQPMVEYNYHKELADTLENPDKKFKESLKKWDYKIITEEEANHIPYRHAA